MREEIQKALDVLVGEMLWQSGRVLDLQWFAFGKRKTVKGIYGNTREIGEYSLHIQCAWRIRHGDQVVVGSRDLFYTPEGDEEIEDFDWKKEGPGPNRLDQRITELFENEARQFLVHKVEVREAGSFAIILDSEYALEVFPQDSLSDEHWRIFRSHAGETHFVVTGKGLET